MTTNRVPTGDSRDTDLLAALVGLAADPPSDLTGRVFSSWCRLEQPVRGVYAAFSDDGVSYLRTSESVDDSDERFAQAFRQRFRRPLLPAPRPPAGLLPALRRGNPRDVRLDLRESTAFERAVLQATAGIPRGETRPYAWVAKEIGRPNAVRAVGSALGRNPVPLLVPCHRVTRSDGHLGGYVFGLDFKRTLLRAEAVDLDELSRLAEQRVFYVGSDSTNVVCFPTCHHARRITPAHRRGFRTLDQAQRAGYRPCLACRPAATGVR